MTALPTGHLLVLGGTGSGKTVTAKGIVALGRLFE